MALERRDGIAQSASVCQPHGGMSPCCATKPFSITKRQVFEAYKKVKANREAQVLTERALRHSLRI
jgi:hypothetical protein